MGNCRDKRLRKFGLEKHNDKVRRFLTFRFEFSHWVLKVYARRQLAKELVKGIFKGNVKEVFEEIISAIVDSITKERQ